MTLTIYITLREPVGGGALASTDESPGRSATCHAGVAGVSSSALLACVDALDTQLRHVHSIMVLRGGHVIAEGWWAPYRADRAHAPFSVSKSVTSTAIGLLIDDGLKVAAPHA